jgi:hypothetical protein
MLKTLNFLLILTSLFGYLEWGQDNSAFLWQAELDVLSKLIAAPGDVVHPFTMLPLAGQLLLLITLFQRKPGKFLTYAGMAGIGVLLVFMFLIGLMSLNFKIALSVLPFLVVSVLVVYFRAKRGRNSKN